MSNARQWMKEWSAWRRRMRALGCDPAFIIAWQVQTRPMKVTARTVRFRGHGVEYRPTPPKTPKPAKSKLSSPMTARIKRMQGPLCYLCGVHMSAATRDHVMPRARGGKNARNVLMACQPCNVRKGERLPRPCELIYVEAVHLRIAAGT